MDLDGSLWEADTNPQFGLFGTTQTYEDSSGISGVRSDRQYLYQTERWGGANNVPFGYAIPVPNGHYEVVFHFAELYWQQSNARVFDVSLEGQTVLNDLDLFSEVGFLNGYISSQTTEVQDGVLNITFSASVDNAKISAIEIRQHFEQHGFLHAVIDGPRTLVDYDGNGTEPVTLLGSGSHTHEPGRHLTSFEWREGGLLFASSIDAAALFPVGAHDITLTIRDDGTPQKTLSTQHHFDINPITSVAGALTRYFSSGSGSAGPLLDTLPSLTPDFVAGSSGYFVQSTQGRVGTSPFTGNVAVQLSGKVTVDTAGTYVFGSVGGGGTRIFIDQGSGLQPVTGPILLGMGSYPIEVRFAIDLLSQLPAYLTWSRDNGPVGPVPFTKVFHDESGLPPFINALTPSLGASAGDETITISGYGFFPQPQVSVQWGATTLSGAQITSVTPTTITLQSPPGTNTVAVSVITPQGTSAVKTFSYNSSQTPVAFDPVLTISSVVEVGGFDGPTQAAWGPDGRLYVATYGGRVIAYTFNDDYSVAAKQTIDTITTVQNQNILGIAFNPFDPPSPVQMYLAHTLLWYDPPPVPACPALSNPIPYLGEISRLTGPSFATRASVIAGLPTSNHDHGVNGMLFDQSGGLLIGVGGNTNAGVAACGMGSLPESPLSAAIIRAEVPPSGTLGQLSYIDRTTLSPSNDQRFGGNAELVSGSAVSLFSPGFRNVFDFTLTAVGTLYATDNGPNLGFGPPPVGAEVEVDDEVMLVNEGSYYGHPNPNRAPRDARQGLFKHAVNDPAVRGVYQTPLAMATPSTNGIEEYRATTFNSALRGQLLLQRYEQNGGGELHRLKLTPDGRDTAEFALLKNVAGLDVLTGPGGAILVPDLVGNALHIYRANDVGATSMKAFDIFPWRAPAEGGTPFIIGGVHFGSLANTSVTVGGVPVTSLTAVSPTRIRGVLPAAPSAPSSLVDVVVQSNGLTSTLPAAFRYLKRKGQGVGTWTTGPALPGPQGEVAGGVVGGVLYIVGEDSAATYAFDFATGSWCSDLASRPHAGHHHAAETINGKLYLFGGLHNNASDKVQIFDPQAGPQGSCGPQGAWTLGATMPFTSGSASSALIGGKVYLAGGIDGAEVGTITSAAAYDPQLNSWSNIAPMPAGFGRNHAASATDGTRLYIFGGRSGPNVVALGFSDVLIYTPSTNSWQVNFDGGNPVPPLPQARGGMGKAVFFNGEFYVIGGETLPAGTGQHPVFQTYNRVDVYNPTTRTWRLDAPMPTYRHGIFPLLHQGRIFVAGGGAQAGGFTSTAVFESLER